MATCFSGILFLRRHSLKVSAKHLRKLHLNPGRRGMAGFHHKPPPDERRNFDWRTGINCHCGQSCTNVPESPEAAAPYGDQSSPVKPTVMTR
jgi:hypothetical protein